MIRSQVLNDALDIQNRFQTALPFRHAVIEGFLEPEVCERLLEDFPCFNAKYALNEHGEVGGKAVVEQMGSISPAYAKFYEYINSHAFLQKMSDLTGIPNLIADATLFGGGTHENRDGQYLDAHIDFNVDEKRMLYRRLNLLIYLNKEWEESWGGNIQLHSNPRYPETNETFQFAPLFNRAVIFETSEYSWHGFETITLPEDKKHLSRKSISIYLYTKDRPAEEVVAPHTTFYICRPLPTHIKPGVTLSDADYQFIRGLLANRDGLITMYQSLLIEKEQRLRTFFALHQDSPINYSALLSSRSWKLIMSLHRVKAKCLQIFRQLSGSRP
jgi:hypothetical protein